MTVLHDRTTTPLTGWSVALELTGRCQFTCTHCYALSGPTASHGTMTGDDWCRLITEVAGLGADLQLIGGEPTLHPQFERILAHAVDLGGVEIFTNMFRIADSWWELLTRPGVTLATSYYSDQPDEHAQITRRAGSYERTRANIAKAVELGIPVRAAIVGVLDGQRLAQAESELHELGVTRIRVGMIQGLGRAQVGALPDPGQLCGRCGDKRLAVSPNGQVTPCVMSRWMLTGNVTTTSLAEIVQGQAWRDHVAQVPRRGEACGPECNPASDGNDCAPAQQVDGE